MPNSPRSLITLVLILCTCLAAHASPVRVGQLWYELDTVQRSATVVPQLDRIPYYDDAKLPTGHLAIPFAIVVEGNEFRVTAIGPNAFRGCNRLTSVEIPAWVATLGDDAFRGCSALSDVPLPDSLRSMGRRVFQECTSLEKVTLPATLATIGRGVFDGCEGIVAFAVRPGNALYSVQEGVLFAQGGGELLRYPSRRAGERYTVPATVHTIASGAFAGSQALTHLSVSASVKSIGFGAFARCVNLDRLEVDPANGSYETRDGILFDKGLRTVIRVPVRLAGTYTLPSSVTDIASAAFAGCDRLTNIGLPAGLERIAGGAFGGCTRLLRVEIPASVRHIAGGAFAGCSALWAINVQEGNAKYESHEGVLFDKGREVLRTFPAVQGGDYQVPASVRTIADWAFDGCGHLTSIILPEGLRTIGSYAFSGCRGISSLAVPATVTRIGDGAFHRCASLAAIELPAGLRTIGANTFRGCVRLASIAIPKGVASIGSFAFRGCLALRTVSLPAAVSSVGTGAFFGCSSLAAINVARGNARYKAQDGVLFNAARTALILYPEGRAKAVYEVPSSVETIAEEAFGGVTALEAIALPASLRAIGSYAFFGSISLRRIEMRSTTPENIIIGENPFVGVPLAQVSLVVPGEALARYQSSATWGAFGVVGEMESK